MDRQVLLLRGINVGRANQVGMAELRAQLTADGYRNVATLLRSGNVVLDAPVGGEELCAAVRESLHRRFGIAIDVVVRTDTQLRAVLAADPLGALADDHSRYLVLFMATPPGPALAELLAGRDFGAERFHIDGAELYAWCPGGVADSPLLTALGKAPRPRMVTTARNWNTVRRLVDML